MFIEELVAEGERRNASDIHITSGNPVVYRIDGELAIQNDRLIDSADFNHIISELEELSSVSFKDGNRKEVDFAFSSGISRIRGNFFFSSKTPSFALRMIPRKIKGVEELALPELFKEFCTPDKGLVLVAGPTGSGKSTTLAALLEHINITRKVHLITIEDPVEYVFEPRNTLIHQRQLGRDTASFANGLKYSMRQDPDVILVGEMRDPETMELAMTAAETGHLVFSTIHTNSAATTPERVVGSFPPHHQNQIAMQLSSTLIAVIYQRLLRKKSGPGRIPILEIMILTQGIRNLIREQKFHQIESMMQAGGKQGMVTFDDALIRAFKQGQISETQVKDFSRDPNSISRRLF